MTTINYCVTDDCKYIATSNQIEDRYTRCDLHKVNETHYYKTLTYISRFREKHGNSYSYYKTCYTGHNIKIIVTCKEHGDYTTRIDGHLAGHNCSKCVHHRIHLSTTEKFVEKAKSIHGDKYDYSKVEYERADKPVTIICSIHGEFEQKPEHHLANRGCNKCAIIKSSSKRKITTEQFVEKAKNIHGDKYDYSKVKYEGYEKPVTIICSIHGEFEQTPDSHLSKRARGCQKCGVIKCANSNSFTTDEFIEKAKNIHGDKYDYSKVDYKGYEKPITIICLIHGEFEQTPHNHLNNRGCQKCGIQSMIEHNTKSKEQFIEEVNNIHKNTYDYSLVDYKNRDKKIKIICKTHGIFEQTPGAHLAGQGCYKCGIKRRGEEQRKSNDEFIKQCQEKHGDTYDYSKVNYITNKYDITIICKKHGEFTQNALVHVSGHGCWNCRNDKLAVDRRFSLETVIENAKKIHGDKYDYSQIEYINNSIQFKIICHIKYKNGEEHGPFYQSYKCHITAQSGCPRCALNGFSKSQIEWLDMIMSNLNIYIINIKNAKEHRIGNSFKLADGYCEELNTIFEFNGCYYHGCPKCYTERDAINNRCKKTYQELYDYTIKKEQFCKDKGYNIISIWECQWKEIKKKQTVKDEYLTNLKKSLNLD
jgi:G:T-mismatch repair DNA endonuclease (very short patch repair protein)